MGIMKAIITFVTWSGVPCHLKVIRLITPKTARKSPRVLTSCASHSRLKPEILRTSGNERGAGELEAVADTLALPGTSNFPKWIHFDPQFFSPNLTGLRYSVVAFSGLRDPNHIPRMNLPPKFRLVE